LIGWHESPRFSPDGRYIAFVRRVSSGAKDSNIHIRAMDRGTDLPVVESFGAAVTPVWAPDGKRLLFVSDRNGTSDLWSIPVIEGKPVGPPAIIKENVRRLLDVTGDGDYLYQTATLTRDIYLAEIDSRTGKLTSRPNRITSRDANGGAAWSPDGEFLAYYRGTSGNRVAALMIRSVRTGEEHELSPKGALNLTSWLPQWFPDSRSLLVHSWDGTLRRLDIRTGEYRTLLGSPVIQTYSTGPTKRYYPSVILAPDGRTIYFLARDRGTGQTRILRRGLDLGPEKEVCRLNAETIRDLSVSPDGGRLVFLRSVVESGSGPEKKLTWSIMTVSSGGGEPKEVYKSSEPSPLRSTMWTKDGRRLFFLSGVPTREMFVLPAEGGEPDPLGIGLHDLYFLNLHPDGKEIVFADEQWNNQLWVLANLFGRHEARR
jgi:Tol biopolymer transport system component